MAKKQAKSVKSFNFLVSGNNLVGVLEILAKRFSARKKTWVVTLNPEFVVAAVGDGDFYNLLKKADILVPDGIGIVWAREVGRKKTWQGRLAWGWWVGWEVLRGRLGKQRVAGVDLAEGLLSVAAVKNLKVGFWGGRRQSGEKALESWQAIWPSLRGRAWEGPRKIEKASLRELTDWVRRVRNYKPDLLLVGLGMKKQEEFIEKYWRKWSEARLAIGVGGAFDFWAGGAKRAPFLVKLAGFEWLWRLFKQPWRWRRQLALARFVWLVISGRVVVK